MKLVLFFIVMIGSTLGQDTVVDQVLKVLHANGRKHLSVNSGGQSSTNLMTFVQDLASKITKYEMTLELNKDELDFWKDTTLVVTSANQTETWPSVFELISLTKVMTTFFIIMDGQDEASVMKLAEEKLKEHPGSSYFFLAINLESGLIWKQVITIKNAFNPIINPLKLDQQHKIVEEYNLQGLEIKSISLDWQPMFAMENCDENSQFCESKGYLADLVNIIGDMVNFTVRIDREPELNWGVAPISGPPNISGTWGGVVGSVMSQDEYQMSMSTWYIHVSRKDMFDFVQLFRDFRLLVLKPRPPEYDIDLFIRPFSRNAWIAIGCLSLGVLILVNVPSLIVGSYAESTSRRMFSIIGWIMFVLVEVYYSGALTMFFTSESVPPFETRIGAIRAYPEWKLMYRSGSDINYLPYVSSGDPDYTRFWEISLQNPHDHVYPSLETAMDRVVSERVVVDVQTQTLREYLKTHSEVSNQIQTIVDGGASQYGLVFGKNSPLTPMFNQAVQKLREFGVLEKLDLKWMGAKNVGGNSNIATSLTLITIDRVVLVFTIMVITIIAVFVTLGIEFTWSNWISHKINFIPNV